MRIQKFNDKIKSSASCSTSNCKNECDSKCKKCCSPSDTLHFIGDYNNTDFGCHIPTPEEIENALGVAYFVVGTCSQSYQSSYIDSVIESECGMAITRTFSASDECCVTSSVSRTVTWITSNSNPVIICPPDETIASLIVPEFQPPIVNTNCSIPILTYEDTYTPATFTRTWTATDDCGNKSTCEQTITLVPKIT